MKIWLLRFFLVIVILMGCSKEGENGEGTGEDAFVQPEGDRYGEIYAGGEYHLGPVDWEETEYENSCGPYPLFIQSIEGELLAGLGNAHNGNGQLCDACVKIISDAGDTVIARVITTGTTTTNSIDLSMDAYTALNSGESPRSMSWYVTLCPSNGFNVYYQHKTASDKDWTSLWVRNISLPLHSVEVKSTNHPEWYKLTRGNDGAYTDDVGFGEGQYTIKITSIDGQVIEDTYEEINPEDLYESSGQFE